MDIGGQMPEIGVGGRRREVDWRLAREGKPLEKVPPLD
jgi:hypothetical protein